MKYQVGEAWRYGNSGNPYIIVDIKNGRYGVTMKDWKSPYYYDKYIVDTAMSMHKLKEKYDINTLEPVEGMNKHNIEVGDFIEIISRWEVTKITDEGVYLLNGRSNGVDSLNTWQHINHRLDNNLDRLIKTNKMNKKIIGYKLLKDTPEYNAGQKFILNESDDWQAEGETCELPVWYTEEDVTTKTKWFEPIYETKPTEVFVDTLAGKVKVTKEKVSFNSSEYMYTPGISRHLDIISNWKEKSNEYHIQAETFKVGCKTFHVNDIPKLQQAIKEVE